MPILREETAGRTPKDRDRSFVGRRYRIPEIAAQAGLSERTIDRVLNNRGQVCESTARESTAREVQQAIADLDRQRSQLRLSGRTFMIDVVMQAPQRFSSAVATPWKRSCPRCGRPPCGLVLISAKPPP
jgi:LacI family transcriptional regulator